MIRLTCLIDNVYPDDTVTVVEVVEKPPPWDLSDLEDWADEHLLPLTGTGRPEGDAGYFLTVTESPDLPELEGQHFVWGI